MHVMCIRVLCLSAHRFEARQVNSDHSFNQLLAIVGVHACICVIPLHVRICAGREMQLFFMIHFAVFTDTYI